MKKNYYNNCVANKSDLGFFGNSKFSTKVIRLCLTVILLALFTTKSIYGQYTKLCDIADPDSCPNDVITDGTYLYGTSVKGSTTLPQYPYGAIFKVKLDGSDFTTLDGFFWANGSWPFTSLTFVGDSLYGTTPYGGVAYGGYGTIFKFKEGSTHTVIYALDSLKGAYPASPLTLVDDSLYGVAYQGGQYGFGVIFKIHRDGSGYQSLLDFFWTNGGYPYGSNSLLLVDDFLYGMTAYGGDNSKGIIYKIHKNGSGFQKLFDFDETNGSEPRGSLTLAGDSLYGMTSKGGANSVGVIFKISKDGSGFEKIHDFTTDGATPYGSLTLSDNYLYGMTYAGGANNYGTLFSINTQTGSYAKLVDFDNTSRGGYPNGSLLLSGGTLYGTCSTGGTNGKGVIFKYKPESTDISVINSGEGVKIYPVPASDKLTIELPGNISTVMQIVNTYGQVVITKQLTGQTENLDVNGLAKGIYILKLEINNTMIIKKIEIK